MDTDDRRKAETRALGAAYFEKVLAEANSGKDPFKGKAAQAAQQPLPPRRPARKRDAELGAPFDEDLEAVGAVLRGSRLYVLLVARTFTTGASLVLIKQALGALAAPSLLAAVHCVPAVMLLLFLHRWSAFPASISKLTPAVFKGAAPFMLLQTLQTLALFAALNRAGVCLVLSWTLALPQILQMQLNNPGAFVGLPPNGKAAVAISLGGIFLALGDSFPALIMGGLPGFLSLLALLLWQAADAGRWLWPLVRQRALTGQPLQLGTYVVDPTLIHQVGAAEDAIEPFTLAFLHNLVPAAVAFVVAFLTLEGRELVEHELSVPAVSGILLSAACWSTVEVSAVLLASSTGSDADFMQSAEKLTGGLQQLVLKCTSAAITLVLQHMMLGSDGFLASLGLVAAASGAALLQITTVTTVP